MIQIQLNRHYEGMSFENILYHNERELIKAINKFNRSNNPNTKTKAVLEECYCYFIRNTQFHTDICDFNTFVQHWTEAHRGFIPDTYLDKIEEQYGVLEGPLYLMRGHSYWNTKRDWRNTK